MKVTGTTLSRDLSSKALLETDRKQADEYLLKRKLIQQKKLQDAEINTLKDELKELKTDLQEIKSLLKGLKNASF